MVRVLISCLRLSIDFKCKSSCVTTTSLSATDHIQAFCAATPRSLHQTPHFILTKSTLTNTLCELTPIFYKTKRTRGKAGSRHTDEEKETPKKEADRLKHWDQSGDKEVDDVQVKHRKDANSNNCHSHGHRIKQEVKIRRLKKGTNIK